MAIYTHQEAHKLPADAEKTASKDGDVAVSTKEVKNDKVKVAAAKVGDVKITVNTDSEETIDWGKLAKKSVQTCMSASIIEMIYMIYVRARLGFNAINTAFFWTELALVIITFTLGFLASVGVEARSSGLLVPFLMFFLPRVTVPIIFYAMAHPETMPSYSDYIWISVVVALGALACLLLWYEVHRFYRQLIQIEAVDDFRKKKRKQKQTLN